jgi:hypothetical protein
MRVECALVRARTIGYHMGLLTWPAKARTSSSAEDSHQSDLLSTQIRKSEAPTWHGSADKSAQLRKSTAEQLRSGVTKRSVSCLRVKDCAQTGDAKYRIRVQCPQLHTLGWAFAGRLGRPIFDIFDYSLVYVVSRQNQRFRNWKSSQSLRTAFCLKKCAACLSQSRHQPPPAVLGSR